MLLARGGRCCQGSTTLEPGLVPDCQRILFVLCLCFSMFIDLHAALAADTYEATTPVVTEVRVEAHLDCC